MAYEITVKIIVKNQDGKQEEIQLNHECDNQAWEEDCYRIGCATAKEITKMVLQDIDEKLVSATSQRYEG